uniref:ATP synthase peripheral stalk subunit F6, mitochondrial n=1 Tax=Neovison vison TaxID=452646 RepID=A0A8C7B3Q6_NEOVI
MHSSALQHLHSDSVCILISLRRHSGVTAVAFNEDLDLVQKLLIDKITEYRMKLWATGGHANSGPEPQQDLERELLKLKQMYGQADINMSHTSFKCPTFGMDKPQPGKTTYLTQVSSL